MHRLSTLVLVGAQCSFITQLLYYIILASALRILLLCLVIKKNIQFEITLHSSKYANAYCKYVRLSFSLQTSTQVRIHLLSTDYCTDMCMYVHCSETLKEQNHAIM